MLTTYLLKEAQKGIKTRYTSEGQEFIYTMFCFRINKIDIIITKSRKHYMSISNRYNHHKCIFSRKTDTSKMIFRVKKYPSKIKRKQNTEIRREKKVFVIYISYIYDSLEILWE
jgi:hypothetical protein